MPEKYYTDAHNYDNGAMHQTPNFNRMDDEEESSFNIMEWVKLILKYWYLFVIGMLLALGFAYLRNRTWQPNYYSEAKLIIESSSDNSQYSFMQGFSGGANWMAANNQLFIIGSYDLVNRVIHKLPFDIDYYRRGRFKTNSLYGREPVKINYTHVSPEAYACEFRFIPVDENHYEIVLEDEESKELYPDFRITGRYGELNENMMFVATIDKLYLPIDPIDFLFMFRSETSLEEEFVSRLSISYIGESSSVVAVSLTSNNVLRDHDFLNTLCDEYLLSNLEEKNEEAVRTIDFISEQLMLISDSLKVSEINLQKYRRENNMVDIDGYTSSVLSKLSELDARKSELDLQDAYFNELSRYLSSSISEETIMAPSSLGISDPILLELVEEFNDLQQRRSSMGAKNPAFEMYSKQMEDVRNILVEVLANVRNVHKVGRDAFQKEYDATMQEMYALPEKELTMINYERAYKINDNYYTFLLQKQSEAQICKASNVPDNKILQRARVSGGTVNAGAKSKTYMMFLAIGLFLPLLFVVLKELLNVIIRNESDLAKVTSLPLLGTVRRAKEGVLITQVPKSLYAEGFRMIRTRLDFIIQRREGAKIISITSAESGDGKTHFAHEIACVYGMINSKVVLIDMDLRSPYLTKRMQIDKNEGIVHAIIGDRSLDDIIVRTEGRNFDFIPAGVVPPNPAELIGSESFMNLLEELKSRYDYILFDTSPLGLVSDPYVICGLSDVNLLITHAGKSNKNILKAFSEQIKADNVPNAYIVLNDVHDGDYGKLGKYYGTYVKKEDNYFKEIKKYYDEGDEC